MPNYYDEDDELQRLLAARGLASADINATVDATKMPSQGPSLDDMLSAKHGGAAQTLRGMDAGPRPMQGPQQEPGNIDLNSRPEVRNQDGSVSTVRSMGINDGGREVLIPTVVGDRVVSDNDAIENYRKTGQNLGKFLSPGDADTYAQQLHSGYEAGNFRPQSGMTADQLNSYPTPASASRVPPPMVQPPADASPAFDLELGRARSRDADSIRARGLELAMRQLVGGLTHTAPLDATTSAPNAIDRLLAMRAQQKASEAASAKLGMEDRRVGAIEEGNRTAARRASAAEDIAAAQLALSQKKEGAAETHTTKAEGQTDTRIGIEAQRAKDASEQGWAHIRNEAARIAAEAKKAGDKTLPPSELEKLADPSSANNALDLLLEDFNRRDLSGALNRVAGALMPTGLNTSVNEYKDNSLSTQQVVGYIMEGGKLAAGDERKYDRMMPQPGDSPERARQKVENIKQQMAIKVAARAKAFEAGGYKVPKLGGVPTGPVRMRFPDGSTHDVSADEVELAKKKGGVVDG